MTTGKAIPAGMRAGTHPPVIGEVDGWLARELPPAPPGRAGKVLVFPIAVRNAVVGPGRAGCWWA
jgi:hypothetical protein